MAKNTDALQSLLNRCIGELNKENNDSGNDDRWNMVVIEQHKAPPYVSLTCRQESILKVNHEKTTNQDPLYDIVRMLIKQGLCRIRDIQDAQKKISHEVQEQIIANQNGEGDTQGN